MTPARIAVADANVLINLIHAQCPEMLASLPRYEFLSQPVEVVAIGGDEAPGLGGG